MDSDLEVKQKVQRQFSRNAEKYVTSPSHATADDLQLLVEWLNPAPESAALDVATGGGHVAKALSTHVRRVIASDLTKQMLSTAKRHLDGVGCSNVDYVLADAENLPFLDGTFDIVTCRIAPHHFPHQDQFIREVSRVLRRGGKFLLIDNVSPADTALAEFINCVEKLRDPSHVRCATVFEWEGWAKASGMELVRARDRKKSFDFETWLERSSLPVDAGEAVRDYVLSANPTAQEYFQIHSSADRVLSFQGDEWMAMFEKR